MAPDPPQSGPSPPKGGLALYANLLDPSSTKSAPGTISRAPVIFKQPSADSEAQPEDAAAAAKQKALNIASALRFQPTKRPQISTSKTKPKPAPSKAIPPSTVTAPPEPFPSTAPSRPAVKSTLADWATADDDDVNGFYGGEKRQRGGRKRRKKNKEQEVVTQNWDDIYDPSRPNNYEEYKNSEEKIREVREWKDRLYAHRMARDRSTDLDSEDEGYRPPTNSQFAPQGMNFAPPPFEEPKGHPPPPPEPTTTIPDDATGEDAYTRRLHMSQQQPTPQIDPPPTPNAPQPPPPPPPPAESPPALGTISRAPVRYNLPPAPPELPSSEAELEATIATAEKEDEASQEDPDDKPRSLRPGQAGFAQRLLSKYGWKKGSGLGATGSGIVNPLRVQVEKQKKKPDSEGGGFATPGGRGKIIGGKKKKGADGGEGDSEGGKFGEMSEVVRLEGMLQGLDVQAELERDEGGLMQEIGEECGEKYGRVERVFIDGGDDDPAVFVKFTSQLSALRAVNALEGRIFNGNAIIARFYDKEKFEDGVYQ